MDILKQTEDFNFTNQSRSQYKIILSPESFFKIPFRVHERTELEIGFGNGEFTVQYAKSNPDIFLYGIEISRSCVTRCARKAADLKNLCVIRADARFMLREFFDDNSLDKVIMNFPCPWPGNGNAHRRVTARDFSDSLAAVLKTEGIFELVTDDKIYSNEVWDKLSKHQALDALKLEVNPERPVTTKYERKWLSEGRNIYKLTFKKIQEFTVLRRVNTTEEKILHIKINNPISEQSIKNLNGISGQDIKNKKTFWKFGNYFKSMNINAKVFLLEVFTSDDEFDQRFYLNISERKNYFLIRMDKTANAFLTPAARLALSDAAERLS